MSTEDVSGVHNGGAVSIIYTFPLNGEMAVGQVTIPYDGMFPSKAYVQEKIRAETGCKTAVVVSAVNVDQAYRERNYSCPAAQFIGGDVPSQAKYTTNHYEDAKSTVLRESIPIKVKILGMRQFELGGVDSGKN
jgi:hypothetical protein